MATIKYLGQEESQKIDVELMDPQGVAYTLEQLMELAGQSVAHAMADAYKPSRVLFLCGPGNNGGDGVVAARHLHHFSWKPTLYIPKLYRNPHIQKLVQQTDHHDIPQISSLPSLPEIQQNFDVICDSIFGFSFKTDPTSATPIRAPYDEAIQMMIASKLPVVSVDIPSGWLVESGPVLPPHLTLQPEMVVSLMAPKLGMKHFKGLHYLGGLFVPRGISTKYQLDLPPYPPSAMFIKLSDKDGNACKM